MTDEDFGPYKVKKNPVLHIPKKVEIAEKIPVRLVAEEVKKIGPQMAATMADPLFRMLELARKQGVTGMELQKMAGMG